MAGAFSQEDENMPQQNGAVLSPDRPQLQLRKTNQLCLVASQRHLANRLNQNQYKTVVGNPAFVYNLRNALSCFCLLSGGQAYFKINAFRDANPDDRILHEPALRG